MIFRHPVLIDPATERPGRRVRRGLGTDDHARATGVVDELNVLLGDERFWTYAARAEAANRFSALAVGIFYDRMDPDSSDPLALREQLLPASEPGAATPPRNVLLLGTTGAGKTTVLRQLIGTTPEDRFPSTSTAKTTIHDIEIITRPGPFRAVATFAGEDEIEEYLKENLIRALSEAQTGADDRLLRQRILIHVDERMRFNYVLGNGTPPTTGDDEDEDEGFDTDDASQLLDPVGSLAEDAARTAALIGTCIQALRALAAELASRATEAVRTANVTDAQLAQQLFDEHFEGLARDDERFHALVDGLMDELKHRFTYLHPENLQRSTTGWPLAWTLQSDDRELFLRAVRRFSSNHTRLFGQLLTPLVNGVRVAGMFRHFVEDAGMEATILYVDGEGLGHTPRSAAALSSNLVRRIEAADMVLLVDNAKQPMQAAPAAAIRELLASGVAHKLLLAFTHMDEMVADNLRSERSRRDHVLASALNIAASMRESYGPLAERAFRKRLDEACFFLGYLDRSISAEEGKRQATALSELRRLQSALAAPPPVVEAGPSRPVYSVLALGFAARRAVTEYIGSWAERLGVVPQARSREPWQRIKALTRRLATPGMGDQYNDLRPVAELRRALVEALYPWIQSPVGWVGQEPLDDEKQHIYDAFAEAISGRLGSLATRRVRDDRVAKWQDAYGLHGRFSTFSRSRLIHDDILTQAAPNPDIALSPEASHFLDELVSAVRAAAAELEIELRNA